MSSSPSQGRRTLLLSKFESVIRESFNIECLLDLNRITQFILLKHKRYSQYILVVLGNRYVLKKGDYRGNITDITPIGEIPFRTLYFNSIKDSVDINICFLSSKGLFFSNRYYLLYDEGRESSRTERLIKDVKRSFDTSSFETEEIDDNFEEEESSGSEEDLIFISKDDNEDSKDTLERKVHIPTSSTIPLETIKNLDNSIGTVVVYLNINTFYAKVNSEEIDEFILTSYTKIEETEIKMKKNTITEIDQLFNRTREHVLTMLTQLTVEEEKRDREIGRLTKLVSLKSVEDNEQMKKIRNKTENLLKELIIDRSNLKDRFIDTTEQVSLLLNFFLNESKYTLKD